MQSLFNFLLAVRWLKNGIGACLHVAYMDLLLRGYKQPRGQHFLDDQKERANANSNKQDFLLDLKRKGLIWV